MKNKYFLRIENDNYGPFEASGHNKFSAKMKKLGKEQTAMLMDTIGQAVRVQDPNSIFLRDNMVVEKITLHFKPAQTLEVHISERLVSSHRSGAW